MKKRNNNLKPGINIERDHTSAYSSLCVPATVSSPPLHTPPPTRHTTLNSREGPQVKRNSALYRFTSTSTAEFLISWGLHSIIIRNSMFFEDFTEGVF